ncbi:MAG: TetR/AcrR family transcriptional regulator [Tissierellia bacterium]|nr:TetR/AcrR family transcriptional regulator [Tissierellia bacterium]
MRKRLTSERRKRLICEQVQALIPEKGYAQLTMEDIMRACGLSKGGLYHHFKSKEEILEYLVIQGSKEKYKELPFFIEKYKHLSPLDSIVEMTYDKIMDNSEGNKFWAHILCEAKYNHQLKKMLDELQEIIKGIFLEQIKEYNVLDLQYVTTDSFMAFMNAIMVSVEVLDSREIFEKNPKFLKSIIRNYIIEMKGEENEK